MNREGSAIVQRYHARIALEGMQHVHARMPDVCSLHLMKDYGENHVAQGERLFDKPPSCTYLCPIMLFATDLIRIAAAFQPRRLRVTSQVFYGPGGCIKHATRSRDCFSCPAPHGIVFLHDAPFAPASLPIPAPADLELSIPAMRRPDRSGP